MRLPPKHLNLTHIRFTVESFLSSFMKRTLILSLATLLLAGCGKPLQSVDIQRYYGSNPLVEEQRATELAQVMVQMIVNEKAALLGDDLFDEVDRLRIGAGQQIEAATKERKNGLLGQWNPHKQRALGFTLVRPKDGVIFTGTTFEADPGVELHIFATKTVDPRTVEFPDAESKDLGLLLFPYGAQTLTFDPALWDEDFRTLVLYDVKLKRVYGFLQLSVQI